MKGSLDHFGDAFCNCVPPSRLVCFSKKHGLWISLDASRYEFGGGGCICCSEDDQHGSHFGENSILFRVVNHER